MTASIYSQTEDLPIAVILTIISKMKQPRQIFSNTSSISSYSLDIPEHTTSETCSGMHGEAVACIEREHGDAVRAAPIKYAVERQEYETHGGETGV